MTIGTIWRTWRGAPAALAVAALVAGCGGGGVDPAEQADTQPAASVLAAQGVTTEEPVDPSVPSGPVVPGAPGGPKVPPANGGSGMPLSVADAHRFLTQATFGPTAAAISEVQAIGPAAWMERQFSLGSPGAARAYWEAADAAIKAADPTRKAGSGEVYNAFWKLALTAPDQLRMRTAFALSELFVISLDGPPGSDPRAVAAWYDMLAQHAYGNYRDLLQAVSLHPMMGVYLSHLKNQKADPATGRVPDENYAREVMQLFSIGLVQLNADGTLRRDAAGQSIPTYGPADIAGLAKVFTGFSWACPAAPHKNCFLYGSNGDLKDPDRGFKPMVAYPAYHSTEEKRFLGVTIPAQPVADPMGSLTVAMDALFQHPNVGPFVARQLIQRFVTGNPSPAYVAAVARAFDNNGRGVRGDLKAVLRAMLLAQEARYLSPTSARSSLAGKVREPVLRLTALMRAFSYASDSAWYRLGDTSNPGTALAQAPLKSPSVFNFFRPGYVPPGTLAASHDLAVPEMQILHETSAAGYVNYIRNAVGSGVGSYDSTRKRNDMQPDFAAELALAEQPATLVDQVGVKLLGAAPAGALRTEIVNAVSAIAVPTPTTTNADQVAKAKRNRVNAAVFLTAVSPEFQVQK